MANKVPCTNPAHGVKDHIAGTAAAIECARSGGTQTTSSIASIGTPTSATPRSGPDGLLRWETETGIIQYAAHEDSETELEWHTRELQALGIPVKETGSGRDVDVVFGFPKGTAPAAIAGEYAVVFRDGNPASAFKPVRDWDAKFDANAPRFIDFDKYRDQVAQALTDGWKPGQEFTPPIDN